MKTWLRLLLVLMTVGGGFTGITTISNSFDSLKDYGSMSALILLAFFALYAFVVVAGLLFVYDSRRTGPMLLALAFQIPWVSLPVFEYHFGTVLNAALAFGPPRVAQDAGTMVDFSSTFETAFQFRFGAVQEGPWRVGVNLIAALLFVLLWFSVRTPGKKAQLP